MKIIGKIAKLYGFDYSIIKPKRLSELLSESELQITRYFPIRVWDDNINGTYVYPSLSHWEEFPTLLKILNLIDADWKKLAKNYTFPFKGVLKNQKITFMSSTLDGLKPHFIFHLFSYINFFFTLDYGFKGLYKELKEINHKLGLNYKFPKQPKWNDYIKKIKLVRNKTVVHWGDPNSDRSPDTSAGKMWGFSFPTDDNNLLNLSFGSSSVVGASDRVLKPLPETHLICKKYLLEFDAVCSNMFKQIIESLPISIDGRRFEYTSPNKKVI